MDQHVTTVTLTIKSPNKLTADDIAMMLATMLSGSADGTIVEYDCAENTELLQE